MAQSPPAVSPLSGNAVLTTQSITLIVAVVVYLARTKGYEIDQNGQNLLVNFLSQPGVGEIIVGAVFATGTWVSRQRVSSELTVSHLLARIEALQERV